ncbi:MAG: hypothetical protein DRH20_09240 [Deltaproteobacteria bacterium]|nr:MAG: hypothetical protein DRH20_09240 [Deltaproteobacteria bacterium]
MEHAMKKNTAFDPQDLVHFEAEAKVGLLATVGPDSLPHVTLISSIRAKTPTRLMWGQFSEGRSKRHVKQNPRTGFLILTMDKRMWRGKALWTHEAHEGEDFETYNDSPMFRYNAYFGIHTVHYMDLVETYGRKGLPMTRIVLSSLLTKLAKPGGAARPGEERILKPWAEGLFNRLDALCFLCRVDREGFPVLTPLIQCQAAGSRQLVFSPMAYGEELGGLEEGRDVAVFGLTMDMEDVLVRGKFNGFRAFSLFLHPAPPLPVLRAPLFPRNKNPRF